ncbi:MAG: hypothetical protein Q8O84_01335 [Nanoarchaeota archaeon]|nr:hypothetical protein [Nanoarchaeota archaeon]
MKITKLKTLEDIKQVMFASDPKIAKYVQVSRLKNEMYKWLKEVEKKPYRAGAFIREFFNIKYR